VRWTYAVHEQILPGLRRLDVPVRWTEVTVRHTGYTDPAPRERKLQRDCKILEAELAERPDDLFVLFNLGAIAVERQDSQSALGHLQRSLRGSAPTDSIVRKLFALIARCHQMLGDLAEALNACSEGLRIDPDDAERTMWALGSNLRVMLNLVEEGCFVRCQAMGKTFSDASALLVSRFFPGVSRAGENRGVVIDDASGNQAAAFRP